MKQASSMKHLFLYYLYKVHSSMSLVFLFHQKVEIGNQESCPSAETSTPPLHSAQCTHRRGGGTSRRNRTGPVLNSTDSIHLVTQPHPGNTPLPHDFTALAFLRCSEQTHACMQHKCCKEYHFHPVPRGRKSGID